LPPGVVNGAFRALYRLLFAERTLLLEGYLLLVGLLLHIAGRWLDLPALAHAGLWMAAPFIATALLAVLVLAPWFALRGRR